MKFLSFDTDEVVTTHGPIEPDKENVRQEPYSLPQGFMWDTLDLSNAEVVSVCKVNSNALYMRVWSHPVDIFIPVPHNLQTRFFHL